MDNSGDYNEVIEEETDLEYDSDVDEVVFTPGTVASRKPYICTKQAILPIHELLMARNYTMCLCHPTRHTWIYYRTHAVWRTED